MRPSWQRRQRDPIDPELKARRMARLAARAGRPALVMDARLAEPESTRSGPTLDPFIREYLQGRRRRGEITKTTAIDYSYKLAGFSDTFGRRPIERLGPRFIDHWLETIGGYAPQSRRCHLAIVRGFVQWLLREGVIAKDPTVHVPAIQLPRRVPVTLTVDHVGRLLEVCPDRRAKAIVWLMVGVGCRCVEVSRLRVEDYDPSTRTIRLVGKAGHEREIPVPERAARALDAYLDEVGVISGPLIRNELDPSRGLSQRTLSGYVRWWMREAGVKARVGDGRSAHGLRRTAGSDVMDRCGDIRIVQAMLGHARIETTAKAYLRPVALDTLRESMEGREYASTAQQVAG